MTTVVRYAEAACVYLFTAGLGVLIVDMAHEGIEDAWNAAVRALTRDGWHMDADEPALIEEDTSLEAYALTR